MGANCLTQENVKKTAIKLNNATRMRVELTRKAEKKGFGNRGFAVISCFTFSGCFALRTESVYSDHTNTR